MRVPERWRPYCFGALAGLLLVASVGVAGQFFGTSTTFPRLTGWVYETVGLDPARIPFYQASGGNLGAAGLPDWQFLFVLGIGVGAFLASLATKTFQAERLPPMWVERFGNSLAKRIGFSLIGGTLAIIGARMAGGCPSGHGLSGVSQLGVSSLVAMCCFFVGGIVTVHLLYRGGRS